MQNIDNCISQISGQQNYLEKLQEVTGAIDQINMQMYKDVIEKVTLCDTNLAILSKRFIATNSLNTVASDMFTKYLKNKDEYSIGTKTFVMVQRKSKKSVKPPREEIDYKHRPLEVFKSDWFKSVRNIEKLTREYINLILGKGKYDKTNITQEMFIKSLDEHPDLEPISNFGGIHIGYDDSKMFNNVAMTLKCTKIIIDSFMNPMYDVRKTIQSNHVIISKAFKSKIIQQNSTQMGIANEDDIIDILYKFIIAKYRVMITGNNKHYVRLFTSIVDDTTSTHLDGAKFLDIMDNLNLDQIDKNSGTYKFAIGAKSIINTIMSNKELDADDITAQINEILNNSNNDAKPQTAKDADQFNDVL